MAVAATDPNLQQEDPNQKDKDPSATAQGGGVNVSGASASGAGGGASTAPGGASATPAPTSSGRFQNLQGYLKANAGYNQGQGLAGQVGTNLAGQEQQQEQGIGQEAQRVQSQAGAAAAPYQTEALNQYQQQAYADPTKVNQAQWAQYYGGQYAAPQAYDATGQLGQQQQTFQGQTGLVGTEPGRMQLLQQLYGTPGYSVGQQSLDNLLLQSQPGQLGQLQQQAGQLSTQLGNAYAGGAGTAQQALDALKASAASGSQALQTGLQGNISQEQAALNQKVADLQAQRQGEYGGFQSGLQSNNLSPAQLAQLGLSAGTQLYNVDPTAYLQNQVGQATVGNVASAADQAKFNALAQMAGQPVQSALGQFANVSGPLGSSVGYNAGGLNQAIAAAKAGYQQGLTGAYNTVSTNAPLSGDWLRSLSSRTPEENLQAMQQEKAYWQTQQQGNPYQATRIQQSDTAINALQDILNRYTPNRTLQ